MEKLPFFHRISTEGVKKVLAAQEISLWNAVCATSVENSRDFRQNSFFCVVFLTDPQKSPVGKKVENRILFFPFQKRSKKNRSTPKKRSFQQFLHTFQRRFSTRISKTGSKKSLVSQEILRFPQFPQGLLLLLLYLFYKSLYLSLAPSAREHERKQNHENRF